MEKINLAIIFLLFIAVIILYIYDKNKNNNKNKIEKMTLSETSPIVYSENVTANKICFDSNRCITENTYDKILSLTNRINNYMYLPDQCIILNDLSGTSLKDSVRDISYNKTNILKSLPINTQIITSISGGKTTLKSSASMEADGTGIQITIPNPPNGANYDYNVLWVQVINTNNTGWSNFRVYSYDSSANKIINNFGKFTIGLNNLNNIIPNGATHNDDLNLYEWYPIPIIISKDRKIMLSNIINNTTFYRGFAFSSNPWNHCRINAITLYNNLNRFTNITNTVSLQPATIIGWNSNNWNNTPLMEFKYNTSPEFRIPFVNSGKNKIFYLIEYNTEWGSSIGSISVKNIDSDISGNYNLVGNMSTSLENPFSKHFNSKLNCRYYGIVIPKEKLPVGNFIQIKINIPNAYERNHLQVSQLGQFKMYIPNAYAGYHLYVREVGTHDDNSYN